jgi:hypothetical protein
MAQHNARTKRSEKGLLNSGQLRCWSWVCLSFGQTSRRLQS